MRVVIDGNSARLSPSRLLGEGGEAQVFAWRDRAVKIFHPITSDTPPDERHQMQRILSEKLQKVLAFPHVDPRVIVPASPVFNEGGSFVGYTMRSVAGALDAGALLRPRQRPQSFSQKRVCEFLKELHDVIVNLHAQGVIIGDLNDGNIVIDAGHPALIDADSFQVIQPGGASVLRCVVAHERYLDPRCFGADLVGEHARPVFDESTDWFAFSVFAFSALAMLHPYGGVSPAFPTLLRRAQAGHSAMRPDVRLPRSARPHASLPTSLMAYFSSVFDGQERGEFPRGLLDANWTQCGCGLEFARAVCPHCSAPAGVVPPTINHGRCREEVVFSTPNARVVEAAVFGRLVFLAEERASNGQTSVVREDGMLVLRGENEGIRFGLGNLSSWAVANGLAVELPVTSTSRRVAADTDAAGRCAFAVDGQGAFVATAGALWDLERDVIIGRTLEGHTRLAAGGGKLFGLYRASSKWVSFVHQRGEPSVRELVLESPGPQAKCIDVGVAFDPAPDGPLLLTRVWDEAGSRFSTLSLISSRGQLLASTRLNASDGEHAAVASGRAVANGTVVIATELGLVAFNVDTSKTIVAAKTWDATENVVDPSVDLLPDNRGGLFVVRPRSITRLTLG